MFLPFCLFISLCKSSCPTDDEPVTITQADLEANAYQNCGMAMNVKFATTGDDKVTFIPSRAFQGSVINTIEIANTIDTFEEYAFQGCTIRNDFTLPANLKNIRSNAFYQCTFGESVTITFASNIDLDSIGQSAFANLENLQISGTIRANRIDSLAFSGCTNLNAPIIITSRENIGGSIGVSAFKDCKNLRNKLTINAPKIDKDTIYPSISSYAFQDSGITELDLPHLKSIGQYAFKGCLLLTGSTTKGLDADSISSYAFANDPYVTFPTIRSNNIGQYAFSNCFALNPTNIQIYPIEHVGGSIEQSAFINCISFANTLEIQEPLEPEAGSNNEKKYTKIGASAFKNTAIKTLNFPSLIDTIGPNSFENCRKLESIQSKILNANTISSYSFSEDSALTLSEIHAKVINDHAFYHCLKLGAKIFINDEVDNSQTLIGEAAFEKCTSLGTLSINISYVEEPHVPEYRTIDSKAFYNSGITGPLKIPFTVSIENDAFAYCSKINQLTFDSYSSIITTIGSGAFSNSNIGTTLTIPRTVLEIGESAFAYTTITTLVIEGSNYSYYDESTSELTEISTEIRDKAFYYCRSLNSVTFNDGFINFDQEDADSPHTVSISKTFRGCPLATLRLGRITTIPVEAFYGIPTLVTVTIPETVTNIKSRAFAECPKLSTVTFDDHSHLTTIGEAAFYKCTDLYSVSIPIGVTSIPSYAYYQCVGLTKLTIPSGLTQINQYAFYGCTSLQGPLNLPNGFTTFGTSAFEDCSSLAGPLEFPDTLTTINQQAFMGCRSLTGGLSFGRSITTIGKYAFRDCTGLNGKLIFPERHNGETKINFGEGAFYDCSSLTGDLTIPQQYVTSTSTSLYSPNLANHLFHGCSGLNGKLILPHSVTSIPEGAFYGCSSLTGDISLMELTSVGKYAFYECGSLSGSLNLKNIQPTGTSRTINEYAFYNCRGLNGTLTLPENNFEVKDHAFHGCSGLRGTIDGTHVQKVYKYGFAGCSSLNGPLAFGDNTKEIQEYGFADCSGFSDQLSFVVNGNTDNSLSIEQCAFKGCTGFKNGRLLFTIKVNEEDDFDPTDRLSTYYRYKYFLKIGNEAFKDTKFKNVYYMGRFQPDCDYDIGISKIKGIHTSSNYANKTFCNYPLHSSKLSGGAIAGIVIACIVVVVAIVILIVWLILRNKKNKDKSEGEVEMNQDP